MKKANSRSTSWIIMSLLAAAIPTIGYLVLDFLYGGTEAGIQIRGQASGVLAILCLVAVLTSAVACLKLNGSNRLVPAAGIVLLIAIGCLSLFIYSFSEFAKYH